VEIPENDDSYEEIVFSDLKKRYYKKMYSQKRFIGWRNFDGEINSLPNSNHDRKQN
jgi:ferredoxin-nitrate reductase